MDRNRNKEMVIALVVAAVCSVVAVFALLPRQETANLFHRGESTAAEGRHAAERGSAGPGDVSPRGGAKARAMRKAAAAVGAGRAPADGSVDGEGEDRRADAFDALTDKWAGDKGGGVTVKDVDDFVAAFKSVPESLREDCLQRALNLIPDDNVLLLAGILFDKSVERGLARRVFNDMLNRDASVKKAVLQKVYKDRYHTCWADAAWILDVTGELPQTQDKQKEKQE